ncbi:MAG: nodulation protein NodZ, partial [Thermodesulfobacteriota bacterium]
MFLLRLLKRHPRVIISHRNSGFGDNLLAAAKAWHYAKKTNRTLVIVWAPSRYLADQHENAFSRFFKFPESIGGVPVIAEPSIDRLSTLLILHPYFFSPRPDPSLILYKVLSKLRINTENLFKQRIRSRQEATDGLINNLIDVRRRIIVTHGCYGS